MNFEGMTTEYNFLHHDTIGVGLQYGTRCNKFMVLRKHKYWSRWEEDGCVHCVGRIKGDQYIGISISESVHQNQYSDSLYRIRFYRTIQAQLKKIHQYNSIKTSYNKSDIDMSRT